MVTKILFSKLFTHPFSFNVFQIQSRSRSICPCVEEPPKSPLEEKKREHTCAKNVDAPRKFIVGGNWKMHGSKKSIKEIFKVLEKGPVSCKADVFVGVPTIYLDYCKCYCPAHVQLAAQNCYKAEKGAFTGETSPAMLKDVGIDWVILGHSERRHIFGESDQLIAEKVAFARTFDLKIVACIGETLAERECGKTNEALCKQIQPIAEKLTGDWQNIVIAYEPVWAIGTGKTASPKQAQEVHEYLRGWICKNVCPEVSKCVRIQYGGSVTEKNCNELASQPDIDGFLVGGASLKPEFIKIINSRK